MAKTSLKKLYDGLLWTFPRLKFLGNAHIIRQNLLLNLPNEKNDQSLTQKLNPISDPSPISLFDPVSEEKNELVFAILNDFMVPGIFELSSLPLNLSNDLEFKCGRILLIFFWNVPNEKSGKMNVKDNSFVNSFSKHFSNELK